MVRNRSLQVLAVGVLLAAGPASATASFANRELGVGVGVFSLVPQGRDPITWGLPITLEGGLYLESGFALYLRIPLMLLQQSYGLGADHTASGTVFGTGGQFGVRYLFLEESVRPYVMVHLAGLYFFRDTTAGGSTFYGGPGGGFGVDVFVAESISLGARVTADLYLTASSAVLFSLGGGLSATTYF